MPLKSSNGGTIFNRGTALYGLYFNRGTPRGSPSGRRLSYIDKTSTSLAAAPLPLPLPPPPPPQASSPLGLCPTTPRRPSTVSKDPPSASGQSLRAVPRGSALIEIKAIKCTAPIKVSWSIVFNSTIASILFSNFKTMITNGVSSIKKQWTNSVG